MNKKGRRILFVLFFVLVAFSIPTAAQERETPPLELDQLSDRLFQILGGSGANGGFYVGDNGVLVIDTKMSKESVEETIEEIKKISDKPILYLVNTHSDGDHIGGNQFFPKTVTIIAHENCRQEFFHPRGNGQPSDWTDNPKLAPHVPSVTFSQKMTIYLGEKKVELWYFGVGHTTGDTVVYFPDEKIAFLGDQIFMGRPQLIHSYKGGNSFEHVKTLTRMLITLEATTFCSGHADPVDRKTVEHHIEEITAIQNKIRLLAEQGKTLKEIQKEFSENHSRLVESIFSEIKN